MDDPLVSVVMPILNEARFIRRALDAVLGQDYPADRVEVLIVDGGSTDGTISLAETIAAADGRVRLLHNPGRIQSCALNIGIDAAHGDVIIRVDGHTIIAPDYVRRCVDYLLATGADNVGGPQRFASTTPTGKAIAAAYRSPFGVPSRFTSSHRAGLTDTVYLGAWPRAVFDRVGRFDESLAANEDYEFNYRIRKAGGRVFLTPDIRSNYAGRQTWGTLARQFFRYGRWKFVMLTKHPESARPRHLAAPGFVAALILGGTLALFNREARRVWRIVLACYGLANLGASIWEAVHHEWSILARLPGVFACMHLSWGSGFWVEAICRTVNFLANRT